MSEFNRREFLSVTAAAAAACACAACPMSQALAASSPARPFEAGALGDFSQNGAFNQFAASRGVILVRDGGKLYALSAHCTHKNGVLEPKDGDLRCPRHGARFDMTGKVTKGPAKEHLARFAISVDEKGRVIVDPTRRCTTETEAGSFVQIK
jgi:nitrite reductase/ring-hydroxylating ferredoxin subunit